MLPPEGDCLLTGMVAQEVALREDGQVQTILKDVTVNGQAWHSDAYWTYYLDAGEALPEGLLPGAAIACQARIYHPGGQSGPGGFDFRTYLLQRGVTIGAYGADALEIGGVTTPAGWMARLRHDLSMQLMDVMGPEHGAYAAAMLLGSRDFLDGNDQEAFRQLGVAHILSVSGYHVGVLAGLLLFLLRPLGLTRRWRMLAEGAVLTGYCLLTSGAAPVVRAALLLLWRELTLVRHRQVTPLHTLCVTAWVQLLIAPVLLTSASFQLTYCAMLGILLVQPTLRRLRQCRSRWGLRIWEALCASAAAQLGVLLPMLYWFGELPLMGLLLNIPVLALAGVLMTAYWLTLAALPVPGLRHVLGALSSGMTRWLLGGIRALASLDIGALWTRRADLLTAAGWVLVMVGLSAGLPARLARIRKPLTCLGAVLLAMILLPLPQWDTTYTQLSVGDADAAVLQDRDMTVVIDTGEDGQTLASYLHQRRQDVELLILTHLHSDHAGGLRALLDADIPVGTCCLPVGADTALADPGLLPMLAEMQARGTALRYLSRGDVLPLPSGSLTVLWPQAGLAIPGRDANDSCLVLLAELRGTTMLLAADLTGRYEHHVQTPADVLKVAHHGSESSTYPGFLQAVDPVLLLLSNGSEPRRLRMEERRGGVPMYDTETDGAIILHFGEAGRFEVRPFLLD